MDLKIKRKEQIIYAAMNVFSKNGFENSKMETIALEAGIGKGTIYGYFSSKKQLFEEMIYFNLEEYKKELSKIIKEENSFSEKLERLFRYHTKFIDQNLDIFQLMNSGKILSESMKNRLIKEQDKFLELVEEMIETSINSGEINKNTDKETTALCLLGGINFFASKRIFIDKMDIDNIDSKVLVDIFMKGIGN